MHTIAIDVGTSTITAAVMLNGRPVIIPNSDDGLSTPAVLSCVDGGLEIGAAAARHAADHPECVVHGAKRLLGMHRFQVQRELEDSFFYTEADNKRPVRIFFDGAYYSAHIVTALFFDHVRRMATKFLGGEVFNAVVTVPALFNEGRRTALRQAAQLAGLEPRRLVAEPTAAALGFAHKTPDMEARVAVVDVGGGGMNVSLVDYGSRVAKVIATAGIDRGGMHIDAALAALLRDKFRKEHGVPPDSDPSTRQRLLAAAENAKRDLSLHQTTSVMVPKIDVAGGGKVDFAATVTRDELDAVVEPVLSEFIHCCKSREIDGRTTLDRLLLIGGGAHLPLVRRRVGELFGLKPEVPANHHELVAKGAAVYGAVVGGGSRRPDCEALREEEGHEVKALFAKWDGQCRAKSVLAETVARAGALFEEGETALREMGDEMPGYAVVALRAGLERIERAIRSADQPKEAENASASIAGLMLDVDSAVMPFRALRYRHGLRKQRDVLCMRLERRIENADNALRPDEVAALADEVERLRLASASANSDCEPVIAQANEALEAMERLAAHRRAQHDNLVALVEATRRHLPEIGPWLFPDTLAVLETVVENAGSAVSSGNAMFDDTLMDVLMGACNSAQREADRRRNADEFAAALLKRINKLATRHRFRLGENSVPLRQLAEFRDTLQAARMQTDVHAVRESVKKLDTRIDAWEGAIERLYAETERAFADMDEVNALVGRSRELRMKLDLEQLCQAVVELGLALAGTDVENIAQCRSRLLELNSIVFTEEVRHCMAPGFLPACRRFFAFT